MNGPRTAAMVLVLSQAGWAQEAAQEPEPVYARIVVEELQPRCFPSGRSPAFDDRLLQGQIVQVGEQVGDYRRVMLPLGVTGYVHKRFATEPAEGMVEASATNVSFRYRPQTSEVPAMVLPQGTALHYLADQGEWWVVRYPAAEAYVASSEIELVDAADAAVIAGYDELAKARRGECTEAVQQRDAAIAAAAELEAHRAELAALAVEFQAISNESTGKPDFTKLKADVDAVIAKVPEGSLEHRRGTSLREEIHQQELMAEAVYLVGTELPKENRAAEILLPEVDDPLAKFDAVGWLNRETPFGKPPRFALNKGGRMLFEVTCNSGRYDLNLLDGVEVGIRGAKTRPDAASVRQLDALKIEILKLPL